MASIVIPVVVPVHNALVGHIWRLMPGKNIYRNWYRGEGAFILKHPEIQEFVKSYFHEQYAMVAFATLCSATERLLRSALMTEGVARESLKNKTLPKLLRDCVSSEHRFFNLVGMCCDIRSIYRINAIRIGAEHGDHRRDQAELSKANWTPPNPDEAYHDVSTHRLISSHGQICNIFDQVDPETGQFLKKWEARGFEQCPHPELHDKHGSPSETT